MLLNIINMFNKVFVILLSINIVRSKHPDVGLNTVQMIKRQNYPIEEHFDIETEDGYLLEMQRIPHGKNNSGVTNRPAVLLMHGLLVSSADFVSMGPKRSIAYLLADAGYDVWLGNSRGNRWSRKHITYDADEDSEYWYFSWHEMGVYDLPAMIDYILSVTGQEQIFYIGHSQGTTTFFVMGSERPEYNSKIRLAIALAPIAYMTNFPNPIIKFIAIFHKSLEWIMKVIGFYEFVPSNDKFMQIGQVICSEKSKLQSICTTAMFLIFGWNSQQFNITMLPVVVSNLPAGGATRQFIHYFQEIMSGKFRQYDYGILHNLFKYESFKPPDYEIDNIVAPVGLFYSANDLLADIRDIDRLGSELPNLALQYLVPFRKFNHVDFLFAIDVKSLLYDRVFALMKQYQ